MLLLAPSFLAFQQSSPSITFGTDPTEPVSRVEAVLDYSDLRLDAVRTALTARFDYAFLDQFVLRAEAPLAHFDPEGPASDSGYGDLRAQFGWRAFDRRTRMTSLIAATMIFSQLRSPMTRLLKIVLASFWEMS